ncbi:Hypothetical predicted protein [Lecanosticta acicola]|uniref:Uncharacterized protein n=1 Tax=Lecanosticta acicola TaxID=111012 RepID=A0AAI9EG07_9PEZI|nr:Hypothetical predicted protein [Lecanosticta acicola]
MDGIWNSLQRLFFTSPRKEGEDGKPAPTSQPSGAPSNRQIHARTLPGLPTDSSSNASDAADCCRFLALPAELRLLIYEVLLSLSSRLPKKQLLLEPALLSSCLQVRREMLPQYEQYLQDLYTAAELEDELYEREHLELRADIRTGDEETAERALSRVFTITSMHLSQVHYMGALRTRMFKLNLEKGYPKIGTKLKKTAPSPTNLPVTSPNIMGECSTATEKCHLLSLPAELRITIYETLFSSLSPPHTIATIQPGLMNACHQIRFEMRSAYKAYLQNNMADVREEIKRERERLDQNLRDSRSGDRRIAHAAIIGIQQRDPYRVRQKLAKFEAELKRLVSEERRQAGL